MDDRSLGRAGSHSNELQVEKNSTHGITRSGGVTGVEIGFTGKKPISLMEGDEPAGSFVSFEGREPTEEELATLRKVADHLPLSAFIVALVELCERFTYYGLSGPFQNYIQYHPYDTPVRGGIGTSL